MTGISPTRVIGGRYVVLGELCRAATGAVWRAEDRVTGRQVAVKELQLPAPQSSEERRLFRERLLRAARAAGRTDAPGIVAVHDVVTDDDVDHVVTELVEAPTLADRVAADGSLDDAAAADLARRLAATLHALHDAGVAHGALTPGSVLLGPGQRVLLADLGVPEPGDGAGEAGFVAPELREGGPPTPESDVWALGATLHHALHGRPPAARATRADRDGPLAGLLTGMLRQAPQARLTARQVTALLESETQPPPRGRADRRWWVVAAVVLGVLAGAAGGFALGRTGGPDATTLTHGTGGDVRFSVTAGGGCLRGGVPGAGGWSDEDRVDCAGPHELEVLAALDPFGTRVLPYPGREQLAAYGEAACSAAFEALVPAREGLEIVALVPSPAAFEGPSPDGRAVHCLLRSAGDEPLVGSRISGEPG